MERQEIDTLRNLMAYEVARHSFDLDCNWKIAMEANTEVYHVRSIHPKTVYPILDDRRNVNTLYPNDPRLEQMNESWAGSDFPAEVD